MSIKTVGVGHQGIHLHLRTCTEQKHVNYGKTVGVGHQGILLHLRTRTEQSPSISMGAKPARMTTSASFLLCCTHMCADALLKLGNMW